MRNVAIALLFMTLGSITRADGKWNDVFSTPTSHATDPVVLQTELTPSPTQYAGNNSTGRQIIVAHLNQIKSSQVMVDTVTLEDYWQGVFAAAGHPELYASSKDDIQLALEAGLSPYLRGEAITAQQFADTALAALQKTSSKSVVSPISEQEDLQH